MRIITATFGSGQAFLDSYSAAHDGGAIFYATRMDLRLGEDVLVELQFPGMPNRALLRGQVAAFDAQGKGAWIRFSPQDESTRDFVLRLARGEVEVTTKIRRSYPRFPVAIPCDWKIDGTLDRVLSYTEDVSASGAFVRTLTPPPVGTTVRVALGELTLRGHVARVRQDERTSGMGVRFVGTTTGDARRLREMLRRVSERGRVVLASPVPTLN